MTKLISMLEEKLDLKKRFPEYFTPLIFRIGIFTLVIFAVLAVYLNGFSAKQVYLKCDDGFQTCNNPFYVCPEDDLFSSYNSNCRNFVEPWICQQVPCDRAYLFGGEEFGKKPHPLANNFGNIAAAILIAMFIANHVFYLAKRRRA